MLLLFAATPPWESGHNRRRAVSNEVTLDGSPTALTPWTRWLK